MTMDKPAILHHLGAMLQDRYDIAPSAIAMDTKIRDVNVDSIHMVDLMLDIESDLGFTFKSMDLPRDATLGDIVDLIQASMAA